MLYMTCDSLKKKKPAKYKSSPTKTDVYMQNLILRAETDRKTLYFAFFCDYHVP